MRVALASAGAGHRSRAGYEYAKSNDIDLEEGDEHADWLLDEAARLMKVEELLL